MKASECKITPDGQIVLTGNPVEVHPEIGGSMGVIEKLGLAAVIASLADKIEIGADGKPKAIRAGIDYLKQNPKSQVHQMLRDGMITEDGEVVPRGRIS